MKSQLIKYELTWYEKVNDTFVGECPDVQICFTCRTIKLWKNY